MQTFMEALGYTFRDPALLQRALTHPSMGAEDNQRLEFLGDAVLQYVMSDLLFRKHPQEQEGGLTHQRALLVCEAALAQVARKLGVGHVLRMDKGEELTGGRDKPSVLADAMEAILAAVYLDGGMEAARRMVQLHWPKAEEVQRPMQDSKGALQEFLQRDGGEAPTYRIIGQDGPPHDRPFHRPGAARSAAPGPGNRPHQKAGRAGSRTGRAPGAASIQVKQNARQESSFPGKLPCRAFLCHGVQRINQYSCRDTRC